jgi:hypothetical protein
MTKTKLVNLLFKWMIVFQEVSLRNLTESLTQTHTIFTFDGIYNNTFQSIKTIFVWACFQLNVSNEI